MIKTVQVTEPNLHGRETIRRMTALVLEQLQRERQSGRNNLRDDEMRRIAQQRAEKLVADKLIRHMQRPLR